MQYQYYSILPILLNITYSIMILLVINIPNPEAQKCAFPIQCVNIHQYYKPLLIFINITEYYLSNLEKSQLRPQSLKFQGKLPVLWLRRRPGVQGSARTRRNPAALADSDSESPVGRGSLAGGLVWAPTRSPWYRSSGWTWLVARSITEHEICGRCPGAGPG